MTLLTPREESIARLVAENKTARQIAKELGVSHGTVRKYIEILGDKIPGRGKPMNRIAVWWHERKRSARRASKSNHPRIGRRGR